MHAIVEDGRQRTAAIDVHAACVLGRQLNGREWVLDVVRDLPCHAGPGFQPLRPLELGALPLQLFRHAVEIADQPPQLVARCGHDARVEIAARDPPCRARQAVHGVGNPLGHPIPDSGAEQAEQHRGEQHAAIELVDLALDLHLPERERHGDDAFASARAHWSGSKQIRDLARVFLADKGRQPIEHDLPVHIARRARREKPRGKEVGLARGLQSGAVEEVDVLIDGAADEHHDLIVEGAERAGAALLERRVVFDEPLRHRRGFRGRLIDARAKLPGEVGPRRDGENDDGDDGPGHEGEEQLPVEARPNLAQQRAAAGGRPRCQRVEQRRAAEEHDVEDAGQRHELGEVHEMTEPRNHRIAERIDAGPVVEEVDAELLAVARERLPERRARVDHALEHRVGERPHAGARRVDRRAAPAVGDKLDVTSRRALRRNLAIWAMRFEVGILRGAERERAVVEHHPNDDGTQPACAFANAAARAQDVAFARSKLRDFGEEIPVAPERLPPRRRVLGLG